MPKCCANVCLAHSSLRRHYLGTAHRGTEDCAQRADFRSAVACVKNLKKFVDAVSMVHTFPARNLTNRKEGDPADIALF